jgi:hypothetical protein
MQADKFLRQAVCHKWTGKKGKNVHMLFRWEKERRKNLKVYAI